jgi:hypothetical protein
MTFQRPVTPTSRSPFVFRTPQRNQRSHSFSRSTTPIRPAEGLVRGPIPLPMSQTSSWGGGVGGVPKSAKIWARTAHLHDVKSAKRRHEQARIDLATPEGKSEGKIMETDDDDVFLGERPSDKVHPDNTLESFSSQRLHLLEPAPNVDHETESESPTDDSPVACWGGK